MKPRSFLGKNNVEYESVDVRKEPIQPEQALKLARKFKVVYGVSGQKVVSYDLAQDKPTDDELKKLLIGRSGTMRAPCIAIDSTFVGGFSPDLYKKLLKLK